MRTDEIVYSPFPLGKTKHMVLVLVDVVANLRPNLDNEFLKYNLYIGSNSKRIFSPSSLPSFIQLKLTMINAIPKDKWNGYFDSDNFFEENCYSYKRFTQHNPEFKHIGWQVSDSIYVIVLDEDELAQLKGTTVDTRKESQRESQENTQRT
tara:strand:- start:53 stop:505 length:453 start_codon:yes stop_codon:yes gene_type:complete